jgi:hypothetical protein
MKKREYVPELGCELYEVETPPMLIEPFIPAGTLGGLSGGPGVGKSWFVLEAARALVTGTEFLDRFEVANSVPVLYIGSDSSRFDYGRCWRRLTKRQYDQLGARRDAEDPEGDDPDNAQVRDLNPLNDRMRFIIGSDFSLDDPEKVDAMIRAVDFEWGPHIWADDDADDDGNHIPGHWYRERGAGLIIMDTFGSLTDQDMIDNTQMIQVYKGLRSFVDKTGATVLLLNHCPKGKETWLGAISQVGKLDFWLHLKMVPKQPDPDYLQVVFKKVRGIRPKDPVRYKMDVNDPAKPDEARLYSEVPAQPQQVVAALSVVEADADRKLVLELLKSGDRQMKDFVDAKQRGPNPASSEDSARKILGKKLAGLVVEDAVVVEKAPGKPSVWRLAAGTARSVGRQQRG